MRNISEHVTPTAEVSIRHMWPKGLLGCLAYFFDHVLYGSKRPIDWPGLWAFEECCVGFPLFLDGGGVLILDFLEVEFLRFTAVGLVDLELAKALGIGEPAAHSLAQQFKNRLGVSDLKALAEVAISHGIK